MNTDKRTMHTDALDVMGTIIDKNDETIGRDAVHLAVEPVIAGEKLFPGADVGVEDGVATTKAEKKVGIVDPFIKGTVPKGEKFLLFVYPRTITSLRHVWAHPDFDVKKKVDRALIIKKGAENWLRNFCATADTPGYEAVLAACLGEKDSEADEYSSVHITDEYFHFGGRDAHGNIPPEFWKYIEIVTGRNPVHKPVHFSCSC